MKLPHYIIAGLAFVIIILLLKDCSRPSEQKEAEKEKAYKTNIAILEAEKGDIQSRQDSLTKMYSAKEKEFESNLALSESKIKALEKKAARQRIVVDTLILNNPDLMAFVSTQQQVIDELKVEVDTLKSQKEFHARVNQDLIAMENIEDKVEQQMALDYTRRIASLEKSLKKRNRKNKLLKIGVIALPVLTFITGSQL